VKILGISNVENSSAAILTDGRVVAAAEEERFVRRKHYRGFPFRAIAFCLSEAGLDINDLDLVTTGWVPYRGWVRRGLSTVQAALVSRSVAGKLSRGGSYTAMIGEQLRMRRILRESFGLRRRVPLRHTNHHLSHMASALFLSPFDEAALLTVDGTGEYQTLLAGEYRGGRFRILDEIHYPYSIGHLYSVFTSFLGFAPNSGEGKLMALAAYGSPRYEDAIRSVVRCDAARCRFRYDLRCIDYSDGLRRSFSRHFTTRFGAPREPGAPIETRHEDIAASVQKVLEDTIVGIADALARRTGLEDLCMAGGVALNCVANSKILERTAFRRVYVPSAPSDAGVSLGSALLHHQRMASERPVAPDGGARLGPAFTREECLSALNFNGRDLAWEVCDEPETVAAERLERGEIVGWFQGRMEFGPRALGARSILAPPYPATMKDFINARVKFREEFRPFAPVIPLEDVPDWFSEHCASPNMSFALRVREDRRDRIPAVTHVNGRARLQTVTRKENPRIHAMLRRFERRTGVPVLLNTSFNVRGEPIVCTPADALSCFQRADMDALFLGDLLVRKRGARPGIARGRVHQHERSRQSVRRGLRE
jgi:carbamoyltransferase